MIAQTIANWHKHLDGKLEGGLDYLLADDVVFYSPVVFSPQKGKAITKLYLTAAMNTLPGDKDENNQHKFNYTKQILSGHQAVLEFETEIKGKYVNGVDIISCNDDGKITEFRVMIRPLQAVNLLHQQMAVLLAKMQGK
jgi:hypothetical protein